MTGYPTPEPTESYSTVADTPYAPPQASPRVNASRLWSAGIATAIVAALTAFVGLLVVRAVLRVDVDAPTGAARAFAGSDTVTLCATAAVAALAATGLAHLLVLSTPRPFAYLSWIIGLVTAAAVVLPFTYVPSLTVAIAQAVINLVVGLAIGSLITGAASSAVRAAALRPGQYEV